MFALPVMQTEQYTSGASGLFTTTSNATETETETDSDSDLYSASGSTSASGSGYDSDTSMGTDVSSDSMTVISNNTKMPFGAIIGSQSIIIEDRVMHIRPKFFAPIHDTTTLFTDSSTQATAIFKRKSTVITASFSVIGVALVTFVAKVIDSKTGNKLRGGIKYVTGNTGDKAKEAYSEFRTFMYTTMGGDGLFVQAAKATGNKVTNLFKFLKEQVASANLTTAVVTLISMILIFLAVIIGSKNAPLVGNESLVDLTYLTSPHYTMSDAETGKINLTAKWRKTTSSSKRGTNRVCRITYAGEDPGVYYTLVANKETRQWVLKVNRTGSENESGGDDVLRIVADDSASASAANEDAIETAKNDESNINSGTTERLSKTRSSSVYDDSFGATNTKRASELQSTNGGSFIASDPPPETPEATSRSPESVQSPDYVVRDDRLMLEKRAASPMLAKDTVFEIPLNWSDAQKYDGDGFVLEMVKLKKLNLPILGKRLNCVMKGTDEDYSLRFHADGKAPRDVIAFAVYIMRCSNCIQILPVLLGTTMLAMTGFMTARVGLAVFTHVTNHFKTKKSINERTGGGGFELQDLKISAKSTTTAAVKRAAAAKKDVPPKDGEGEIVVPLSPLEQPRTPPGTPYTSGNDSKQDASNPEDEFNSRVVGGANGNDSNAEDEFNSRVVGGASKENTGNANNGKKNAKKKDQGPGQKPGGGLGSRNLDGNLKGNLEGNLKGNLKGEGEGDGDTEERYDGVNG